MGYLSANPSSDADRAFNLPPLQPKPPEKKPLIVVNPIAINRQPTTGSQTDAGMSPVMIAALVGLAAVFMIKKGRR